MAKAKKGKKVNLGKAVSAKRGKAKKEKKGGKKSKQHEEEE